jgi:ribonuclease HIII
MNSNEIRVDEDSCNSTISSLKTACEFINEATNTISSSSNHIEFGLRGSGVGVMMYEYNNIVKSIKNASEYVQIDIKDINNIVTSFIEEDESLAKSESIRR